jgi:hypothetical protein
MKYLLFSCCLFMGLSAHAQNKKQQQFAATTGLSLPMGSFAKAHNNSGKVGYAGPGGILALAWMPQINKKWQARIAVQYQAQLFADGKAEKKLNTLPFGGSSFFVPAITLPVVVPEPAVYPNWVFNNSYWSIWHIRGGVQRQFFPASGKGPIFQLHAIAGVANATTPNMEGRSITDTARATFTQKRNAGWGFSYQLGATVILPLLEHLHFSSGLCWDGTSAIAFNNTDTRLTLIRFPGQSNSTIMETNMQRNLNQQINALSLQAGFVWVF